MTMTLFSSQLGEDFDRSLSENSTSMTDTSGRMAKWTVELNEFNLSYILWYSMKAQILVDFIVECTPIKDSQIEDQPQEEISEPT